MIPGDDEFKEIDADNLNDETEVTEDSVVAESFEPEVAQTATPEADSTVTVQPVQFASFEDLDQVQGPQNQNLNILLDVKLIV